MQGLLNNGYQKSLLKKWAPVLEAKGAPAIESEFTKLATAQVLESTYNDFVRRGMISEAGAVAGDVTGAYPAAVKGTATSDGGFNPGVLKQNDFNIPNIVMPMVRRIFPNLIANELVGVQPLNGPLGYAVAYRPTYGKFGQFDNSLSTVTKAKEIAYDAPDTRHTGASAEAASYSSTSATAWQAYAGSGSEFNGTGAPLGAATEYAKIDETYPEVTFGLTKTAVDVKTRKLGAHWSPEMAEDLMAMHGIDVEAEMTNLLTYEIGAEIDRQIVTEMVKAAITGGSITTWNPASADGLDQMGRIATLLTKITVEAQKLAIKNRRGHANFVISTPKVCAVLEQLTVNKFVTSQERGNIPAVPASGIGALSKVGLINDGQQLLVRDTYATGDYALLGYKGQHPADSGIIYCPYIPVQLTKVVTTDTFTPALGARTRYGIMNTPWDASRYYSFINVAGIEEAQYTLAEGQRLFV